MADEGDRVSADELVELARKHAGDVELAARLLEALGVQLETRTEVRRKARILHVEDGGFNYTPPEVATGVYMIVANDTPQEARELDEGHNG